MKKPKLEIQTWQCNTTGDKELQHFLPPDCTYVFGFNRKLLGNKAYQDVLRIVNIALCLSPDVKNTNV